MRPLAPNLASLLAAAVLAGCAGAAATPSADPSTEVGAAAPQVVIESPPGNAQVAIGQAIEVVTTGVDGVGVARIDLLVDGTTYSSASAPAPQPLFRAVHVWTPGAAGSVELRAVAFRSDGTASQPMAIRVEVVAAGTSIEPYPTYSGPEPTYRANPVPSGYAPPTYKPAPTTAPTYVAVAPTATTYVPGPTPTYHANPTTAPTYQATPTYEATPTAAATAPVAPPDADLHWSIPYNGASEIANYVSYPAGDVEDKVYWSVTGLNNNPPGDHGTLNVFATCEGLGTEYITFQIGANGPKFRCGTQVIVQQLVTSEANTGLIRVYAFAGAYVHWTLSGNVAP